MGSTTIQRGRTRSRRRSVVVVRLDELLRLSAGGDAAAFAALYDETASRAYGLSLRVLRDRTAAEDAVQEAYLTIWRTASRFDPSRGTSLGWIFMIVHRTAIDHVRMSEARSNRDDRHAREDSVLRHEAADPTPELAHATDEARVVREALAGLSTLQRRALELAYFDGYTYSEVARLLGIPLSTAKTRIRDGQVRLRQCLALQAAREAQRGV